MEGLRIAQNFIRDGTSVPHQSFIGHLSRKRFNQEPEYISILSYDMAAALQAHMRRTDGMGLKQALLTLDPFDGLQQK